MRKKICLNFVERFPSQVLNRSRRSLIQGTEFGDQTQLLSSIAMDPESPYDVSSDALRTLMDKRKQEIVKALEKQGGITNLTEKLQTSSDGLDGEEEDLKRRRVRTKGWQR